MPPQCRREKAAGSYLSLDDYSPLMPAKAGIQFSPKRWVPAFAGTNGSSQLPAFPYPPAVGVWRMIASPASMSVESQPFSFSIEPSLRRTEFSPT